MARKSNADTAKDKAAKQKKIVIVLVVVLALAMAFAIHTMSSLNGGSSASSKPQPVTVAPIQSATTPAATVTPVAPSLAGTPIAETPAASSSSSTSTTAGSDSSQLIAVVIPTADQGQLDSFSRFESKDPFASAGSATTTSGGSSSGTKGSGKTPKVPPAPPAPPAPPPTSALVSVNGTAEMVQSGAGFPFANPVTSTNGLFQLVSLTAQTATVSVVGGSYASGSQTLTLHVNKPVTLVNTADGTRYTLILYPQGTAPPIAAPTAPTGSTTPTTTTPTTTGG
jgi:hypothetical protein